jgi:predicted GH43/DUF377 family glycosyl hydrolase
MILAADKCLLLPPKHDPLRAVPSIREQTDWEVGFFGFPSRFKTQYFNPGLVEIGGERWLITRRRRFARHPGKNDLTMWRLRGDHPLLEIPIRFPQIWADEHWEDPRGMVTSEGGLFVSYSNFKTWNSQVHQALARVNGRFQATEIFHPVYGKNGRSLPANTGHEKNWLWFEADGELYFVYSTEPHVVVRTKGGEMVMGESETSGVEWGYGHARGGAPPVLVDGLMWSFFHSSIDLRKDPPPRRRYYMGAYAFEPWEPFRVTYVTRKPLLVGSEADPRELSAPLVVFPCGALIDLKGTWTVSLGVNDCASAYLKVPHEDLLKLVSRI